MAPTLSPTGHRVVVVAFPDVQVIDAIGPAEVFSTADRLSRCPGSRYTVELVGPEAAPLQCSSGISLVPQAAVSEVIGPIGTLVIAGGQGVHRAAADAHFLGHLTRLADASERVVSVCTGAFLLAAIGRLNGRRATTHWSAAEQLAQTYPEIAVEPDRIFVCDPPVWTSAGVTAGIDLALELVRRDHGYDAAAEVARWLVVFVQRPGGQTQFSVPLEAGAEDDPLTELQMWMVTHPDADLSVGALAARCHLSPRTLHRLVRRQTGLTPATWVEQVRVEAARRALESTTLPISAVASRCGFRTVSTLYRAFERRLGVTPVSYRNHFQPLPDRSAS